MARHIEYRVITNTLGSERYFDIGIVEFKDGVPIDYKSSDDTSSLRYLEALRVEYGEEYSKAFSEPVLDVDGEDIKLWIPTEESSKKVLDESDIQEMPEEWPSKVQEATKVLSEVLGGKLPPLPTKPLDELKKYLIQCPNCKGYHFRHAGFLETTIHFSSPSRGVESGGRSVAVKVCVNDKNCKTAVAVVDEAVYDVTPLIKLDYWDKVDTEIAKQHGPSGNCRA